MPTSDSTASTFDIISPIDGSVYRTERYAEPAQIEAAVARAQAAFRDWRALGLAGRVDALGRFAAAMQADSAEIARHMSAMMGRPLEQANEADWLVETLEQQAEFAAQGLETVELPGEAQIRRFARREPYGLFLGIAPWNYPVGMAAELLFPPLLAGNVVLFKHAPQTALISDYINRAAEAAGLPQGVVQALHMRHPDAERLIGSGAVRKVSFIGSTRGGLAVHRAAAGTGISVTLELGGKDACYIRPDANLEAAATRLIAACFDNAGQSCCSVERLYLHRDIHDRFLDIFLPKVEALRVGHPLEDRPDIGPVVTMDARRRIEAHIADAVARGARLAFDRTAQLAGLPANGAYVAPQVVLGADDSMQIMREETFGPVVPVSAVASDEEAIARINDSDYGLTGSIWTEDHDAGVALADAIDTGCVYVNQADHADPYIPWGGVRGSGEGRTGGVLAYHQLTQAKAFHVRDSRTHLA